MSQPTEPQTAEGAAKKYQGASLTVHDIALAAALKAVGVVQKKPATIVSYGGARVPHFLFGTDDGEGITTEKHIRLAASEPLRFIAENPQHPLAFALASVITLLSMQRAVQEGKAMVGMRMPDNPSSIVWLVEGSRKHIAAKRRGLVELTSVSLRPSPVQEAAKIVH